MTTEVYEDQGGERVIDPGAAVPMNSEWKAKWLEALRSGDYKQVAGMLKGQGEDGVVGYCCLGVLAEINNKLEPIEEALGTPKAWQVNQGGVINSIYLPENLARDEYGLGFRAQQQLANMNDKDKMSFDEIANWIEENL